MTDQGRRWWDVDLHPEQVSPRPVESPEWRRERTLTVHSDEIRRIS